ncbi:peroxidase family protein [Acaryochloris marina NIES-2412]|uniref:peroxidase family protein n=1 Tax=Acaryochloris marina TaxID=155978 RepID=UPI0040597C46
MKHGNESFFIKNEGLIVGRLFPLNLIRWVFSKYPQPSPNPSKPEDNGDSGDPDRMPPLTRQFCRLFPKGAQPDGKGLCALGQVMEIESGDPVDDRDSDIPAGYTYLGQFIDHDITLDRTKLPDNVNSAPIDPNEIDNFRTPALDLDSLYLDGPQKSPQLYKNDCKSFKIGSTSDVLELGVFENDLPRLGNDAGEMQKPTDAVIGDARNDENLAIAQTHLAFLKYHNALVVANPKKSFTEIQREVVLHYQAIVLTDFLPRVLDQSVLNDVLKNGRKYYTDDKKDCMPIEFSVAAYRMGHSMIRPTYEWNKLFNTDGDFGIATLVQLFEFTGFSGSRGAGDPPFSPFGNDSFLTLPSNWIVDWRRLYDFSQVGGGRHPQLNVARKLDARMSFDLKNLPEFESMNPPPPAPLLSLATRNLLRGRLISLPNGQEVAKAIGENTLSPTEIMRDITSEQAAILQKHNFDQQTPLWFYILREAMVQGNGNHLGRVGSRIVAETFVGLIENSPINVLKEEPGLTFSMPELLMAIPNDLNPLGD